MPYADVNGIRLYYETEGNGPPVVLITGLGGDTGFWRKASGILSSKHTVIKIDNRGAGRTSYSGLFSLDDAADDVLCLIDHLGLGKVSILGWSMGSHIAMKAALKAPERMTALILVSSYRYRPARSKYILSSMIGAAEGGMPAEYLARVLNCMCYTEEFFRNKELKGETVRSSDLGDPAGLRHQIDAVELSDMTEAAGNISVPTLLIHGSKDIMAECGEGLALADTIKGCETVIIEGAGHLIPAESYIFRVMEFIEGRPA